MTTGVDLPDLRIVAGSDVILHEDADERRVAALARRLGADGVLRNPPVVAPLREHRFVVLDGANRTAALRTLGVRDVLVQVADYDSVHLGTWYHLVVGEPPEELLGAIRSVAGLEIVGHSLDDARQALVARRILAYCVEPGGAVHGLADGVGLARRVELLRRVVASYKGRRHIHRLETDDMPALRALYSEIAGLVVFPSFLPAEILAMADEGVRLPSGISRHIIPSRALRVNVDLDVLWSDALLAEKNHWLAEWVRAQLQAGRIRHYQEPTFLFDE